MMSSEEDTESFGLYGEKLLKKAKRTRQCVDAGEPRNSYSSIPNFSSRPSFISGGLYGSIFNQQQPSTNQQQTSPQHQHFSGLFNNTSSGPPISVQHQSGLINNQQQQSNVACNNFAPSKMLNELLGRQMKAADAASSADINMIGSAMDSSVNNTSSGGDTSTKPILNGTVNNNNTFETTAAMIRNSNENDSNHQLVDNAHMLRDILQGRKKELLALEQELRAVGGGGDSGCPNNNNNEIKVIGGDPTERATGGSAPSSPPHQAPQQTSGQQEVQQDVNSEQEEEDEEGEEMDGEDSDASEGKQVQSNPGNSSQQQQQQSEPVMDGDNSDSYHSDLSRGSNASLVHIKEEVMMMDDDVVHSPNNPNANKDLKQVPTETVEIKRARVENIVSSMRSSPSLPVQVNGCKKRKLYHPQQHESARYGGLVLDDDDDEPPALKQKRVEKDALKTQLRTMQEQLAEMQQKYLQLCNRMEMESDCQDENTGDMSMEMASASAIAAAAAAAAQAEELLEKSATPTNPAAAAAAAAAMYLGVGHKMFLEQEAQRLKEAVGGDHPHHPQLPPHTPHHHHPGGGQVPPSGGPLPPPPQGPPHHHPCPPPPHHHHHPSSHQLAVAAAAAAKNAEFSERFPFFRNGPGPITGSDLEGLAEVLKSEISASLTILIDSILSRFVQQRRFMGKQQSDAATEQLNKDLLLASQLLDRKSPRTKPPKPPTNNQVAISAAAMPVMNGAPNAVGGPASSALYSMGSLAGSNPFCHINSTTPTSVAGSGENQTPQPSPQQRERQAEREREMPAEQNEALSLVVTTKKKRHKVTDTRITPRTVSRILSQDGPGGPPPPGTPNSSGGATPGPGGVGSIHDPKYGSLVPSTSVNTSVNNTEPRGGMLSNGSSVVNECPSPRPYHPPPPPMLPVSLPTSVAIPNPGLHESQVFSPYSPFYGQHQSSSPPDRRDAESPISHPPTLLHPALLAAHGTPDYGHMRSAAGGPNSGGPVDTGDRGLDCNSADSPFDGMQPALSFSNSRLTSPVRDSGKKSIRDYLSLLKQESLGSLNEPYSSTLTPMHLRKAKLMFFWVRYPSSAVLKMYFPDIKFNKNNTAQLVKWFSNFREFYYIQMEKYARQAITEGLKNAEDIHVTADSEIYRVLNLHYNRNNHIEVWGPQVPSNFRYVVESTLREFFKAIQTGKDTEQSWKKSIYKVISRLDDPVPEYFKSPNFLEQLE